MAEPELRFTPNGQAVANFRIVENQRKRNSQGEWEDGDPTFLSVSVWGAQAENVCESVDRGDRVVVIGELTQRSYENRDGEKRTVFEIRARIVAASLQWASAKITKIQREGGSQPTRSRRQEPVREERPAPDWASSQSQAPADDYPPY